MSSNIYDILKSRAFVQQVTDEEAVQEHLGKASQTIYVGVDPTMDSLHVGHLMGIMALYHFAKECHRPLFVLGGGTAMVGDPSGRTQMRQLLDTHAIDRNLESIRKQIHDIFSRVHLNDQIVFVDNAEWLRELNYLNFLRDIGKHFSVNRMLSMEAYKQRWERGLSFLELNYQLLQAYDFLEVLRRYDCTVQFGGDDQWGNIIAGVDLCRRVTQRTVYGITWPLLCTSTGAKMGKTATGAVWLDAQRFSPYDYYQYWVNSDDQDVISRLAYFTTLPMCEIKAVSQLAGADLNSAKSILAYEATAFIHGVEAAQQAHAAAQAAFGQRPIAPYILSASQIPRQGIIDQSQIPSSCLLEKTLENGICLVELLSSTGLAKSKNEARRLIKQRAVRMENERVQDEFRKVSLADFVEGSLTLWVGKKKVHRLLIDS